jgi:hypothetical protein
MILKNKHSQLLVSRITGKVKLSEFHTDGKCVYQDLQIEAQLPTPYRYGMRS